MNSDGSQRTGIGGMWVPINQASPPNPVYVGNATGTAYHPPASSFLHHRSSMATSQQRTQPQQLQTAQAYDTPFGPNTTPAFTASPSQTSTFAPPHPIATGPLGYQPKSFLNVPSGIAVQTSPIQHSPYDIALYPSPDSGPSSAPILEPSGYVMKSHATTSEDRLVRQQSTSYMFSRSDTSETPLSAAFPQNMQSPYAPLDQQYSSNKPIPSQWIPVRQQGIAPVYGGPQVQQSFQVQQGNYIQVHYQSGQLQSNLESTSHMFEAPQSTPDIYQYRPEQLHLSSLRPASGPRVAASMQPAAPQYEPVNNTQPFVVPTGAAPSSQPHLSSNQPVQLVRHEGEASGGWIHYGQSGMPVQHAGIPVGFTASHSQIPSTRSAGNMVSDDGEEEEHSGTFGFDPYLVR